MKKYLLHILILFCFQFAPAKALWVTIPDPNFVTWLQANYPSCMSGNQMNTNCSAIYNTYYIYITNANISDISGIEYFVNLTYLNCQNNQLTNLPNLPTNLVELNCIDNQITSLPSLPNSLQILTCSYNQLANLPTLPDSLKTLKCRENQLVSLPTLPDSLKTLDCYKNQLTSLPALPNALIYLECDRNQITNLPTLPNSLKTLICGDDQFQNPGGIYGNQLTSLPNLPGSLIYLDCSANLLTGLPTLPDSLQTFICSYNQLSILPTLPNTLEKLIFRHNLINSWPIIPNSLQELGCGNNQLTTLPVLPSTLTDLRCENNQLYSLPNLPSNLNYLNCSNDSLTSIPSLPNTLTNLLCYSNQLTNLPVLPSTLYRLHCFNNQLTNIIVSQNSFSNLYELNCSNNLLTNIPSVPNQMYFYNISNNNISCLMNLPSNVYVGFSGISNNPLTCVPNQTNYSLGLPLCLDNDPVNNPNNCPGANITGYVYTDLNNNCIYDNTDWRTENIPVKLYDNQSNFLALSYTVSGVYSFTSLLPDTFQVKIDDIAMPVSMSCSQPNNQTLPLDSANQTISNINFPVVCDTAYDLETHSVTSNGLVFPGQMHTLYANVATSIIWYNLNCSSSYSGTVTISITGPVSFVSAASGALTPQVTGNTFTYSISNFDSLTSTSFGLILMTDTSAQAGNQICVHVEISPTPLDSDTTNNVFDFCYQVVNSYDPNMKEVYPVNVLPGYDDWFTYTIHFQNTGNAPAFNIRLRDTLDSNLDLSTFEMLGYSHPAIISMNGNILTIRFNNIMLPDSTTDYEGSMGYFQYRIKPLPNLAIGTQIENTAYIYFDFNAPIVTNTTQNNFQLVTALKSASNNQSDLLIYPNPSNGIFNFKDTKNLKQVEVFNLLGEQIVSQGNQKQINLSGFANGIYYARINGEVVVKLLKE